jgi:hypothetical protein
VIAWSAGAGGGASAVTIAEEPGKGGCRRRRGAFSTPRISIKSGSYSLSLAATAQQCAIAAVHQRQAALDQANGAVA